MAELRERAEDNQKNFDIEGKRGRLESERGLPKYI
jgi:hypothetical protein